MMSSKTRELQNPMFVYDFRTQYDLPRHVFSRDNMEHRLEDFAEFLPFPAEFDGAEGGQLFAVETETEGVRDGWCYC